jgi:hypothetical protein
MALPSRLAWRVDDEMHSLRAPVHRRDSRLPKQAEQMIRCLTFVAAERRSRGKAWVHEV